VLRAILCLGLSIGLASGAAAQAGDTEDPCLGKVRLRGPVWDVTTHQLEPGLDGVLDAVAAAYRERCVGKLVVIESHAYSMPSAELNEMLAEIRAAVVRHELEKRGVPRSEMSLAPIGDRRPMFEGSGPDWVDRNRRITFRVAN